SHGVTRGTHEWFAEEIEAGVVQHRQTGGFPCGVQEFPIKRIFVAIHGVHADQVTGEGRRRELLAMSRPYSAHCCQPPRIWTHLKIFRRELGGDARGKLAERFAMLDEDVEVLGRVRVERRSENAAVA